MFKVYNKSALTRKERFQNAIVLGIPASIGLGIVYGIISRMIHIEFSVVYVAFGYLIGTVICNYGKGVQVKFSVLAACLAALTFLIGDMISIAGLGVLDITSWPFLFWIIINDLLSTDMNSLLSLAFRALGIYMAYTNARVV